MEAVGRLAGGVAHDFNNLLMVIRGYCDLITRDLGQSDPMHESLDEIKKSSTRAAALTNQLLAFSRKQVLQLKVLDLNQVVVNMNKLLRRLIGEHIQLSTVFAEDLHRVKVDPGQIEQVIMNLAVNAHDAMPDGGQLTITTRNVEITDSPAGQQTGVRPGDYALLSVSDTGCGMDTEVQAHIFEPFFTTKEPGKGTGLGLSTVYGIVSQCGGAIRVNSGPGRGTLFQIYLPRAKELEAITELTPPPSKPQRGSETILLVEDEEAVRILVRKTLELSGYVVLEAKHGADALRLSKKHKGAIHLMLTDVVMPEMGGHELATRIALLRPAIKVLYMSGYTDSAVHQAILGPGAAFLEKPATPETLTRQVREILDQTTSFTRADVESQSGENRLATSEEARAKGQMKLFEEDLNS